MSNRTNLGIGGVALTLALVGLFSPPAHAGTPGGPSIPNPPGTGVQCFQAPCPGVSTSDASQTVETVASVPRNAVRRPAWFRHHHR